MIDVGQIVGNYAITAKLGEGGMGAVFLAEHPVIARKAALKAIHPPFARRHDALSRFVTEARAINQIAHEHIVNITDFGTTADGDVYFIMEYLEGGMLSDEIHARGAFPPARALNIAAQIADALQASHDHGVIHRDLKPGNVFLIARDETLDFVKVLDFGLAKLTDAGGAAPAHHTGPGTIMGTPYYMSPEQCEGKVAVDRRADIYALGVILFEMLTGHVPFGGASDIQVITKHVVLRAPTVSSLAPALSPAMDAIVARALSKDPARRFQTMTELRRALLDPERYLSELTASVRDDEPPSRPGAPLPAARGERPLGAASRFVTADLTAPVPPRPTRRRSRGVLFLGVAALAALAGSPTLFPDASVLRAAATKTTQAAVYVSDLLAPSAP